MGNKSSNTTKATYNPNSPNQANVQVLTPTAEPTKPKLDSKINQIKSNNYKPQDNESQKGNVNSNNGTIGIHLVSASSLMNQSSPINRSSYSSSRIVNENHDNISQISSATPSTNRSSAIIRSSYTISRSVNKNSDKNLNKISQICSATPSMNQSSTIKRSSFSSSKPVKKDPNENLEKRSQVSSATPSMNQSSTTKRSSFSSSKAVKKDPNENLDKGSQVSSATASMLQSSTINRSSYSSLRPVNKDSNENLDKISQITSATTSMNRPSTINRSSYSFLSPVNTNPNENLDRKSQISSATTSMNQPSTINRSSYSSSRPVNTNPNENLDRISPISSAKTSTNWNSESLFLHGNPYNKSHISSAKSNSANNQPSEKDLSSLSSWFPGNKYSNKNPGNKTHLSSAKSISSINQPSEKDLSSLTSWFPGNKYSNENPDNKTHLSSASSWINQPSETNLSNFSSRRSGNKYSNENTRNKTRLSSDQADAQVHKLTSERSNLNFGSKMNQRRTNENKAKYNEIHKGNVNSKNFTRGNRKNKKNLSSFGSQKETKRHLHWQEKTSQEMDDSSFSQTKNFNQNSNFQRSKNRNKNDFSNNNFSNNNKQLEVTDNHQKNSGKKFFGFRKLEGMIDKEPEIIMAEMQVNENFKILLNSNLEPDYIVLILKLLATIATSSFIHNKTSVVTLISYGNFLKQLSDYLLKLCIQNERERKRNRFFWNDPESAFGNLIAMCNMMIDVSPSVACDNLQKVIDSFDGALLLLRSKNLLSIPDKINQMLEDLKCKFNMCKEEQSKRKTVIKKPLVEDEEPPEDFREISVYPLSQEVTTLESPFLRENVIKGPYKDAEHYLDVQFRLLREDFVAPLRQGICDYLKQQMMPHLKRNSSVKVYQNVRFLYTKNINDQVGVVVQLEIKNPNLIKNLEKSRRFMYGSLICFTKDNFFTLIFGKVIERTKEFLQKGQLVIGFEEEYNSCYEFETPYIMTESKVYFEPYYHVLTALKLFNPDEFPMKKYFIDVNNNVSPPKYLIENEGFMRINNHDVPVLMDNIWYQLKYELPEYDKSQLKAFQCALTKEFVVIQGPPGTGKTYLGLKIAEVLLNNVRLWNENKTPLLVVCFTNHALDQFLEGLLCFTTDIIRVGGQCKNEALKDYNLNQRKRKTGFSCIDKCLRHAVYEKRTVLGRIFSEIKAINETIDCITKNDGIMDISQFYCIDKNIRSSWFCKSANKADILEWFFGGRDLNELETDTQNIELNEIKREVLGVVEETEGDNYFEEYYEETDQNVNEDDNEIELVDSTFHYAGYLINFSIIEGKIQYTQAQLDKLQIEETTMENYLRQEKLKVELRDNRNKLKFLTEKLGEKKNNTNKPEDLDYNNPRNMRSEDRWGLYFYWLNLYMNELIKRSGALQEKYSLIYKEYAELRDAENLQFMNKMKVIGMTTTGAARLQSTLQALKPPIVVVEEAAEVLESHVVVSLTKHCQQLILIGDHQQLRPTTADYKMETKYKLGISLFERMINNDLQLNTLSVQHRMRPEIASLIVPAIYPNLENHHSVLNFQKIRGIDHSLFFIDHREPEKEADDYSKMNNHEAKYLIQLARYLLLNGYKPEDITILAAYSGQMFNLWQERKKCETFLKDVRITVLDNYQGEESKIILLSLVRNNTDGNIGFLKIENRVCVALSRAKEGFYIMGNMDLLCSASEIWPKIRVALEKQNALGKYLSFRCQLHPDQVSQIRTLADFNKVPEGGCLQMCDMQLNCGHKCKKCCHLNDRNHEKFRCLEPCERVICEYGHLCPKKCFETCGTCMFPVMRHLPCKHQHMIPCCMGPNDFSCQTLVNTTLPCGHNVDKPCFQDPRKFRCPYPCDSRIEPCGHACRLNCHFNFDPDHIEYQCTKPCDRPHAGCSTGTHICRKMCYEDCSPCEAIVLKKRTSCSHAYNVQCSKSADDFDCLKPCKKTLPCGHSCKRKCNENCGGCQVKVEKHSPCGHTVKIECCKEPQRLNCKNQCTKILSCGHRCQNKCKESCTRLCKTLVRKSQPSDCGHDFEVPCHLKNETIQSGTFELTKYCSIPCGKKLDCGHTCKGTCGSCSQDRIHQECGEKCGFPLICGHECLTPCRESCPPCNKNCSYKCVHSKCKKKCGEICTECKEPCTRRCMHIKCGNFCGEICNVPPCTQPCPKRLRCGHECIGFCGDPCPPLCRVCDHDELTTIFFGNEDDDDARFVLLLDCNHVVESEGMEMWLSQDSAVGIKQCPICKSPLTSTLRYSEHIKMAHKDVTAVKIKCVGRPMDNEKKQKELYQRLNIIFDSDETKISANVKNLKKLIVSLLEILASVFKKRRIVINTMMLDSIEAKIIIIERILKMLIANTSDFVLLSNFSIDYINFLFDRLHEINRMSNQTREDFEQEIMRLNRIVQLEKIQCSVLYKEKATHVKVRSAFNFAQKQVFICKRYSDQLDNKAKEILETLNREIKGSIAITELERRQIVSALNMKQGHWFKCPNGHPYVIADCGGAMVESNCPECGERIGGQNHALLGTNQFAPEMDGASHPAWSDAANMNNYRFDF